jgi:hypothetical protein
MALITPPVPLPLRRAQWARSRSQQKNVGWTGKSQIVRLPIATRWTVSGEFPPIVQEANSLQWQAFFEELDGMANTFPVRAVEAQQTTAANLQVNLAGQTGSSLNLKGLTGTTGTTFLAKGRKISVTLPSGDVQLETLSTNLVIAAGGLGVATFKGTLREAPANNAAVEVQFPFAIMRLTNPDTGYTVDAGQLYGFAFEAEEAF